ncbi:MAG: hypothetical protein IH936_15195, partial [Acidobacteria bacterium]|nr:hypothetical protein [Acidobacteriota bacterium]
MAGASHIRARIASEGLESVVREILASLQELDPNEQKARLKELADACGVNPGDDAEAWRQWLETREEKNLAGARSLALTPGTLLPPDVQLIKDVLQFSLEPDDEEPDGEDPPPG